MRILLVGTSFPDSSKDWKGLFILRLVEALSRRRDIDLETWTPPGPMPDHASSALTPDDAVWLSRLMRDGGIAHLLRESPIRGLARALRLLVRLRRAFDRSGDADIYHINWLQNAISLPRNGRPILLTALGTDMQLLQIPGVRCLLRRTFRGRPVAICPNAQWMTDILEDAFGDVARIHYVPFGIDPHWFRIERMPKVTRPERWLVVSRLTQGKLGPLFEWCQPLFRDTHRELHVFGPMQEQVNVPQWVHYHGPTTPSDLSKRWFPQACGLITLSQHAEGRPQVMLEAMASGLPIVASRLPAHDDLLHHGVTGWLCDDPAEFAAAIESAAVDDVNTTVGLNARNWTADHIGTWNDCADRYAAIYQELLA